MAKKTALSLMTTVFLIMSLSLAACHSGGGSYDQPTESSEPINHKEEIGYKQALIRCYKTGGTRIVKINGILRCF